MSQNPQKSEQDLEKEIRQFFVEQWGFPADQVVTDWLVADGNERARIDIAIVSKDNKTPLAFIEVKQRFDSEGSGSQRVLERLSNLPIPMCIATGGTPPVFYFLNVEGTQKRWERGEWNRTINDLEINRANNEKVTSENKVASLQEKRKDTTGWLYGTCVVEAVLIIFVLICDFRGEYALTFDRITLLSIGIALPILPLVQKLKILGLEITNR